MTFAGPNDLLRLGLLEGVSLLVAHASATVSSPTRSADLSLRAGGALGPAVAQTCASLGAHVVECEMDAADDAALDDAVAGAAADASGIDLLVIDGAALFARGLVRGGDGRGGDGHMGMDGHVALRACMDGAWNATRAVVNNAFLQAPAPRGRVILLAPAPDAGAHAAAAIAGLENLARTLSIEWARYAITTVTIAPGPSIEAGEVATLVAYLASPAGAYFSGCLLDLCGV